MPSKLTKEQKQAVVTIYRSKTKTITEMAKRLGVSTRTIGRVLVEAGETLPVQRLQADAAQVMKLLYKHKITVQQLEDLLYMVESDRQGLNLVPSMIQVATQQKATRKSPSGHTGKQILLPMDHIPAGAT